jgi:hypothetical protein
LIIIYFFLESIKLRPTSILVSESDANLHKFPSSKVSPKEYEKDSETHPEPPVKPERKSEIHIFDQTVEFKEVSPSIPFVLKKFYENSMKEK